MSDSTWDKIKAIPKATAAGAAAGSASSTGTSTSPGRTASPSLPADAIIERKPKGQTDTNLPLKGSVYDPARSSGPKKISSSRGTSRPLSRRT